jgi:hypothetical protein
MEQQSAAGVAGRFGYSVARVRQGAADWGWQRAMPTPPDVGADHGHTGHTHKIKGCATPRAGCALLEPGHSSRSVEVVTMYLGWCESSAAAPRSTSRAASGRGAAAPVTYSGSSPMGVALAGERSVEGRCPRG